MSAEDGVLVAQQLVERCVEALGPRVLAAILHGSLTLGDFVPGTSDVDVLVVVEGALSDEELDAVEASVLAAPPATWFDLRIVQQGHAPGTGPGLYTPFELEIARHLDLAGVEVRRRPRDRDRDIVLELSIARTTGRSLLGPLLAELIAPIPPEQVLAVGVAQLEDWQRLPFEPVYAELMVFTACRIWRFAIEGTHSSKMEAAEWVRGKRSDLVAAGSALRARRGGASPAEDAVRELLAAALSAAAVPGRGMSPDLVQGQRPEGTGAGG